MGPTLTDTAIAVRSLPKVRPRPRPHGAVLDAHHPRTRRFAAISASIPFQADERGRLDVLYGIATIGRSAVVLGRYLSMLAFAVAAVGLGTATTLVMGLVRHQDLAWPLIATMLLIAVACVGFSYAVQLPWFFALGFTRGRPMMYIPVGIIAIIGFIVGQTGWFAELGPANVLAPSSWLAVAVLVGVSLLFVGSAAVAIRLYRRREL